MKNLATFIVVLACLGQLAVGNPRWNSNGRSARNGISHGGSNYHTLGIQPGSTPSQQGRGNDQQFWWQGSQSPFSDNAAKNRGISAGGRSINLSGSHGCGGGDCLGVPSSISATAVASSSSSGTNYLNEYLPPPAPSRLPIPIPNLGGASSLHPSAVVPISPLPLATPPVRPAPPPPAPPRPAPPPPAPARPAPPPPAPARPPPPAPASFSAPPRPAPPSPPRPAPAPARPAPIPQQTYVQTPYTGPYAEVTPFPGCAAAMKCVTEEFCSIDGVMVDQAVSLSAYDKEYLRVPLMPCMNTETNKEGFCCRDPLYEDPWPADMPMPGMNKAPAPSAAGGAAFNNRPTFSASSAAVSTSINNRPSSVSASSAVSTNNFRPPTPAINNVRPSSVSASSAVSTNFRPPVQAANTVSRPSVSVSAAVTTSNNGRPVGTSGASFSQPAPVHDVSQSYLPPPAAAPVTSRPAVQASPTYQAPPVFQSPPSFQQPARPAPPVFQSPPTFQQPASPAFQQPARPAYQAPQQAAASFQQTQAFRPNRPQSQANVAVPQGPSIPYQGPFAEVTPFPGCAAALKCVKEEFCNLEGTMVNSPVSYSAFEKEYLRVPLMGCLNTETNEEGFCCRDPLYNDPWPAGMPMP